MNILIIEDEMPAYKRLAKLISEAVPDAQIIGHLDSVSAAKSWLDENKAPDLLMLDIHLADGSAFDLIKEVDIPCPIIFTTAYSEYALEAFKSSGLDYLLKPIKKEDLEGAMQKVAQLKGFFGKEERGATGTATDYRKRFIIRFGEHIKTLQIEDIAYCYSESKATFARTHDGRNLPMDYNLDALEGMLNPQEFFRINRQYIISLKAIEEMRTYTKARVLVTLIPAVKEPQVVSSERAAAFKQWLSGEV
jgi:DNA-binding LytR/AlgR family response regulator